LIGAKRRNGVEVIEGATYTPPEAQKGWWSIVPFFFQNYTQASDHFFSHTTSFIWDRDIFLWFLRVMIQYSGALARKEVLQQKELGII